MGDLVPIPIDGGMDQSVSRFLGKPRLVTVNRARFVQPGELVTSPGYSYVHATLPASNRRLRAIGSSLNYGLWAAYTGNVTTTGYGGALAKPDQSATWAIDSNNLISPCEAPRRLSIGTQVTSLVPGVDVPVDVQLVPTVDCSLVLAITGGTMVNYVQNGVVVRQKAFPYSGGGQGLGLIAAGRSVVDSQGSIYIYTSATDSWAKRYSNIDTTLMVFATPNFGRAGTAGTLLGHLVRVNNSGDMFVYAWDGANLTYSGTISHTVLPAGIVIGSTQQATMMTCCIIEGPNKLVILAATASLPHSALWIATYDLTTLANVLTWTQITYTGAGIDAALNTISPPFGNCVDSNGNAFFIFNGTRTLTPGPNLSACAYLYLEVSGVPTLNLVTTVLGHQCTGQMSAAPSSNEGFFFVTTSNVYELWLANNVNPATQLWGQPTLCGTWGQGEISTTTVLSSGMWIQNTNAPIGQIVYGAAHSDVTGKQTQQMMLPGRGLAIAEFASSIQGVPLVVPNSAVYTDEIITIQIAELSQSGGIMYAPFSGVTVPSGSVSAPDLYAVAGDSIACGSPFELGAVVDSAGLTGGFPVPILALSSASGALSAGTYQYCLVLEIVDSRGQIRRSCPGPIQSIVSGVNSAVDLVFDTAPPTIPGLAKARYVIYRTLADGSVFYDTSDGSYQSVGFPNVAYTDKLSDASLAAKRILYTQGSSGGISGQKPNYGMPACRCAWRGRDRLIVGGLERTRRVRWSKLVVAGEAISFPHAQEAGWFIDVDDDVMAVAQLDDAWIILCQNSIFAVYGAGPNDDGSGPQFEPARRISNMIGCHNWRSLLELPEGLLFQAQDGGIYLIVRGTLQIIWFSEKVRDTLGDVLTGRAVAWVTAAIAHDTKNTIHFVRDTDVPVVYDRRIQSWSIDSDGVSPGLVGACCGCSGAIGPNTINQANANDTFPTVFIGTEQNGILFELCGNGAETTPQLGPNGATAWSGFVETNDMALWGLGGFGQIARIALTVGAPLSGSFPLTTTVNVSQWATRDIGASAFVSSLTPTFADANDARLVPIEPVTQKCSSYRIRVEWSAGETIVGLTLEAEGKPRLERTPSAGRA